MFEGRDFFRGLAVTVPLCCETHREMFIVVTGIMKMLLLLILLIYFPL